MSADKSAPLDLDAFENGKMAPVGRSIERLKEIRSLSHLACAAMAADNETRVATLLSECRRSREVIAELAKVAAQGLRFVQVYEAYTGAMTAAEVETRILSHADITRVEIGANSCAILASFDLFAARAALAKVQA